MGLTFSCGSADGERESRDGPRKLADVNRAPRWLLPTVLAVLVLAVVVGTVFR